MFDCEQSLMWSKSCSQQALVSLKPVEISGGGKSLQKERSFGHLREDPSLWGAILKNHQLLNCFDILHKNHRKLCVRSLTKFYLR